MYCYLWLPLKRTEVVGIVFREVVFFSWQNEVKGSKGLFLSFTGKYDMLRIIFLPTNFSKKGQGSRVRQVLLVPET